MNASKPLRVLDVDVTAGNLRGLLALPIFVALAFVPLVVTPSGVNVHCTAADQTCVVDVVHLGVRHAAVPIDLYHATSLAYETAHQRRELTVVAPQKQAHYDASFGNADALVLQTLQTFIARPASDLSVSSSMPWYLPLEALGGLLAAIGILSVVLAKVRVRIETDGAQTSIHVRRWPLPRSTLCFAANEVIGADVETRYVRTSGHHQQEQAMVRILLRREPVDLLRQNLPPTPAVTELAQSIDMFLRFGTTPGPTE